MHFSLLVKLSNSGVGCFVGSFAYADDIVLDPTPTAIRKSHSICDEYANYYCVLSFVRLD